MLLKNGTSAPDFCLYGPTGAPVTLSVDLAGRPVALFLWTTDESHLSRRQIESLIGLIPAYRQMGLQVVLISRDAPESRGALSSLLGPHVHVLSDPSGDIWQDYRARLPWLGYEARVSYLLDASHKVCDRYAGQLDPEGHAYQMIGGAWQEGLSCPWPGTLGEPQAA